MSMPSPHIGFVRGPLTEEQFLKERDQSRAEQRAVLGEDAATNWMGNVVHRKILDASRMPVRAKGPANATPLPDPRDRSNGR